MPFILCSLHKHKHMKFNNTSGRALCSVGAFTSQFGRWADMWGQWWLPAPRQTGYLQQWLEHGQDLSLSWEKSFPGSPGDLSVKRFGHRPRKKIVKTAEDQRNSTFPAIFFELFCVHPTHWQCGDVTSFRFLSPACPVGIRLETDYQETHLLCGESEFVIITTPLISTHIC